MSEINMKGPEVGYIDLLDHGTESALKNGTAIGQEGQFSPIRPSSAGKCTRELFYELMEFNGYAKYEKEPELAAQHRIFRLGTPVERQLLEHFRKYTKEHFEIRYSQQVLTVARLQEDKILEGSTDGCFISDKWKCLMDAKSKKDKFSASYASGWDEMTEKLKNMASVYTITDQAFWVEDLEPFLKELDDPWFSSNFLQVNLYLHSDFILDRDIDHGAIIQYNKNDSRLREVRFNPSAALYEETIKKFNAVLRAVEEQNQELASKDHILGSAKCRFCKFKSVCWDVDANKAYYKTFKKKWAKELENLGNLGSSLESLLDNYEHKLEDVKLSYKLEQDIVQLLTENKLNKIRRANGQIWELKYYKDSIRLKPGKN